MLLLAFTPLSKTIWSYKAGTDTRAKAYQNMVLYIILDSIA